MSKYWIPVFLAAIFSPVASAADLGTKTGTMWAPYLEWSLTNTSVSGNAYDLIATATFTHSGSGEKRTTQMFYDGGNTWKFRFAGTRPGTWTFTTSSSDPDLNGHTGTAVINSNPDPKIRGFLTYSGNKYALQTGDQGETEGYLHTVYMNAHNFDNQLATFGPATNSVRTKTTNYLNEALNNGFDTIFVHVNNSWFKFGTLAHNEHSSREPDPETFRVLDTLITTAHAAGGRVHLWAWGDESRKWTPIGAGGINGTADRRLQRYIAARLGPLPGWTMGYGFDLHEWTSTSQLNSWAQYLQDRFGWPHLLCTRGEPLSAPNTVHSYDGFGRNVTLATTSGGPQSYQEIVDDMNGNTSKPHFYEERHSYQRSGFNLSMDGTRRLLWWEAMAGGMGGFFGFYTFSPHPYPNPEQLRTHYTFWHENKRFLLGMQRDNGLSSGSARVLRDAGNKHYVFYREGASSIEVRLSGMSGSQPAVAVDLKKSYQEIDLGTLSPSNRTMNLPSSSDWAIAVGDYGTGGGGGGGGATVPTAPTGLAATAVSTSAIDLAWQDNSSDEDDFQLQRSPDNVSFSSIATLGAGTTSFGDTGRAAGTTYYYRVRARNSAGNSPWSNVAGATTQTAGGGGGGGGGSGIVITNTTPSTYAWSTLGTGAVQYTDRAFTFSQVPAAYDGLDLLQTANDDKGSSGTVYLTFDVDQDVTVCVAYDDRFATLPGWMAGFSDTGDDLVSGGGTFRLYCMDFSAGTVTLGGNNDAGQSINSMYSVVVAPAGTLGGGSGGGTGGGGTGGGGGGTGSGGTGAGAGPAGNEGSDGCGATGMEALLLLGLATLRRRCHG